MGDIWVIGLFVVAIWLLRVYVNLCSRIANQAEGKNWESPADSGERSENSISDSEEIFSLLSGGIE
jgi:hypothetical protein